jgi:S-adenosylmethionine:diacylglycerol 3-amino-3-carboxypropyl transferase
VARLVRKEGLGRDPETIVLEDAACLAFLELDLAAFSARHEEDDVVRILARSWRKLSPRGQETALALDLPPGLRVLLDRALAP